MISVIGRLQHQKVIQNCFTLRCLQFSSLVLNFDSRSKYCTLSDHKENPLFDIEKLPKYNQITGEVVSEAIPELVKNVEKKFSKFEETLKEKKNGYNWNDVMPVSEKIFDPLSLAWKAVTHLHGVKNNPSLREAYQKVIFGTSRSFRNYVTML